MGDLAPGTLGENNNVRMFSFLFWSLGSGEVQAVRFLFLLVICHVFRYVDIIGCIMNRNEISFFSFFSCACLWFYDISVSFMY